MLFVDLDDFKTVNDSLGHAAGDELLVGVAARLEACLRGGDTCARLGGDEFGVLLEGLRPPEEAEDVATRIAEALETPFETAGNEVYARASIGVALGSTATRRERVAPRTPTSRCIAPRPTPARSVEVFESGMQDAALQRLELRADLERAVTDADFVVHYQPIVALETGRVVGLEALVRWQHPARGLLEPDTFVAAGRGDGPDRPDRGDRARPGVPRRCAGWQGTVPGADGLRSASTSPGTSWPTAPSRPRSARSSPSPGFGPPPSCSSSPRAS